MPAVHVGSIVYDVLLKRTQFQQSYNQTVNDITNIRRNAAQPITFKVAGIQGLDAAGRSLSGISTRIAGFIGNLAGRGIGSLFSLFSWTNKFSQWVRRAGDTLVHFGQITAVFSYRLTLLTAGITAAAVVMGKGAADFNYELGRIMTQLDVTGEGAARFERKMHDHIVNLTREMPIMATDFADAMYLLVSSLTVTEDQALAMLEPIGKMATAVGTEAKTVADAGTVILNVFDNIAEGADGTLRLVRSGTEGAIELSKATADQVGGAVAHMWDVIWEAIRRGRADPEQMITQLGDFMQLAETVGLSLEESMALYAEATRVTTPSQAATWTANLLRSLIMPSTREALKSMNIDIGELVEGTGEYVAVRRGLNDEEERNLEQIERQLAGREGLTGLYLREEDLLTKIGRVERDIGIQNTLNRQDRLADLNKDLAITREQIALYEQQRGALAGLAEQKVQVWTGKVAGRPGFDIFLEVANYLSTISDETERLAKLQELMPSIRATQGMLLWLENYKEIVGWAQEWETTHGGVQRGFDIMVARVRPQLIMLQNDIRALGEAFFIANEKQILGFIKGLRQLIDRLLELPEEKLRAIVSAFASLAALAPVSLAVGTVIIGIGTLVSALGVLTSRGAILVGLTAFSLFGDSLTDIWKAIRKYNFRSLSDLITFVSDLAIQLGLIKERDVSDILESFGIELGRMGDPNVKTVVNAFGGMWDRIVAGWGDINNFLGVFGGFLAQLLGAESNQVWDLWDAFIQRTLDGKDAVVELVSSFGTFLADLLGAEETTFFSIFEAFLDKVDMVREDFIKWADAFKLLLKDIEERKGSLGSIVGFLIDLWEKVLQPFLAGKWEEYKGSTPEERKTWLDRLLTGLIVGWAAGKILQLTAAVVNVVGGAINIGGGLLSLFGLGGAAAGGKAAAGAVAGGAVGGGLLATLLPIIATAAAAAIVLDIAKTVWKDLEPEVLRGLGLPEGISPWVGEMYEDRFNVAKQSHWDWMMELLSSEDAEEARRRRAREQRPWGEVAAPGMRRAGEWWLAQADEWEARLEEEGLEGQTIGSRMARWLGNQLIAASEQLERKDVSQDAKDRLSSAVIGTLADEVERKLDEEGLLAGFGEEGFDVQGNIDRVAELGKQLGITDEKTAALEKATLLYNAALEQEDRIKRGLAPITGGLGQIWTPGGLLPIPATPEEIMDYITGGGARREEHQRRWQEAIENEEKARRDQADAADYSTASMRDFNDVVKKAWEDDIPKFRDGLERTEKKFDPLGKTAEVAAGAIEKMTEAVKVLTRNLLGPKQEPPTDEEACLNAGGRWVNGKCEFGAGPGLQHGGLVLRDMVARLHKGEVIFNPRYPRADLAAIIANSMPKLAMQPAYAGTNISLNPSLTIGSFSGSQADMVNLRQAFRNMTYDAALELERKMRAVRRDEDRRRE